MFIIGFAVATLISLTSTATAAEDKRYPPMLPDTYKDVFIPNGAGKPKLGTTKATCWARGGMCIHIRYCTELQFEAEVSGCTDRLRVCCKNFRQLPPTVGVLRSHQIEDSAEDSSQEFGDRVVGMLLVSD